MADQWDNIDILRGIDRYQQETYRGGPPRTVNGMHLMQHLTGAYVHDRQQVRGFIQELRIARDLGCSPSTSSAACGRTSPMPTRTRTCRPSRASR